MWGKVILLNEAIVVNACFNATDPNVGLALSADNSTQKCCMADTGLLVTQTFMDKEYTDNELDKFRKKFSHNIGNFYILYPKDVMEKDGIWHLPLYMAMFL